jgi:hypothetical protein
MEMHIFFLQLNHLLLLLLLICAATTDAANGTAANEEDNKIVEIFGQAIKSFVQHFAQKDRISSGSNQQLYLTYHNVGHMVKEFQDKVANNNKFTQNDEGNKIIDNIG